MHRCAIATIQSAKRCSCQIRLFFNLWFNYFYLLPYIFTFSDFCTWHLGSLQYTPSCSRQFRGRTNSSSNVPCTVTRQPWCPFMSHVSVGVVRPVVIPNSNTKDTPYAAVWNSQIGEYLYYLLVPLTILLECRGVVPYSNTKDTAYAAVWNSQIGENFTATYWPVPLTILLELYGQWLSPIATPKTPLMLLCETVKSVSTLLVLIDPLPQLFCWSCTASGCPLQLRQRRPLCCCVKQLNRWVLYCYLLTHSPYSKLTLCIPNIMDILSVMHKK